MTKHYQRLLKRYREGWFSEHEIKRMRPFLWRCARPNTGRESFWVCAAGPALVVHGDLGELILTPHASCALRWALGAGFDPDYPYYPLTKLALAMREQEFQEEEATAWLEHEAETAERSGDRTELAQVKRRQAKWAEARGNYGGAWLEQAWHEIASEHGDSDPPSCRELHGRVYVLYLALCWFMEQVREDDPRFAEELAS